MHSNCRLLEFARINRFFSSVMNIDQFVILWDFFVFGWLFVCQWKNVKPWPHCRRATENTENLDDRPRRSNECPHCRRLMSAINELGDRSLYAEKIKKFDISRRATDLVRRDNVHVHQCQMSMSMSMSTMSLGLMRVVCSWTQTLRLHRLPDVNVETLNDWSTRTARKKTLSIAKYNNARISTAKSTA